MNDALINFTADLVRLPSVLGNEGPCAERVVREMKKLGYEHSEIDHAGNAVGVIEGGHAGPTVVLDGHLDTVDVMPREAWSHDPFGAEIVEGRMYGRGTSDMKGAVAAMVYGAARVDRKACKGRIVVSASVGEELIEGPALRCVLERYPADFVIIGEATNLDLVVAGRGRAEFVITTHGTPSHASRPDLGDNAVHKMMVIIAEFETLRMPEYPGVGKGVMALTDIISKPYPAHSVIPSGCRATYERRLMPGETLEELLAVLRRACARANAPDTTIELATCHYTTYTGLEWHEPKWLPAWVFDESEPIVARARVGLLAEGLFPRLDSYQFCTNAAYSAGTAGIPTIGFGPSNETLAHVVDEYIELEQLTRAAEGYQAIVEALLA